MALYYLSHGQFPGSKAHTIQMVKMCEAFAQTGTPTTLIHPSYGRGSVQFAELAAFYDLDCAFDVVTLPTQSGKNPVPNVPTSGEIITFFWLVSQMVRGRFSSNDIVFSRYLVPTFAFLHVVDKIPSRERPTILFEQHHTKGNHPFISNRLYHRLDGVVCIADQLGKRLTAEYNIPEEKLLTAHDGVTLERYEGITQQSARERVDIPQESDVVMYTGHLYEDKQVETLVRAASQIDADIYVVGGYHEDIERIKTTVEGSEQVTFTGFVEPTEIPYYQRSADVLVATAEPTAEYYSPLKLFEYMAAGKPIVAIRTPAFEEVLEDGESCLFVDSNDSSAIASKVNLLLTDPALHRELSEQSHEISTHYSWKRRAERIIYFSDRLCS